MTDYRILGTRIDRIPPDQFVSWFVEKAAVGGSGYVCVPNVHQCVEAYDKPDFAKILRDADATMSDSAVLQKFLGFKYGLRPIKVLRGDLLTLAICRRAAEVGVSIALVGGKDDAVLKRMIFEVERQCPGVKVSFACSPPFGQSSLAQQQAIADGIRESGARIVFVGLGCPKQERWMSGQRQAICAMMIGVGAAFDFISGEVKTSPDWVHSAGLEWLHRLVSEPRRLWRRYFGTGPRFVWLFLRYELARRAK